jgi:O-antigen/teichoic acid export membrane protein
MQFSRHIGKGLWAFADKALPAVYGIGFIFLVVRVLPEKEYGAFAVLQSIFQIISAVGFSLALNPLTKFAAETRERGPYIVASLVLVSAFFAASSLVAFAFRDPIAMLLDPSGQGGVAMLLGYLPLLFLATLFRNFAVSLLQAEYRVQQIFWIDAVYFLGTLILFIVARGLQRFDTALDIVQLNAVGLAASSAVAFFLVRRDLGTRLSIDVGAFRRIWDFGKYNVGSNLNYLVYSQMDVFLVSRYAGVVVLASYSAAKIVTRLYDMVAQVLQMFIMPAASKLFADGEREKLSVVIEKSISFSMLLLLPVSAVLVIFPEFCINLIYSGKYDSAAPIMRAFGVLALLIPWNNAFAAALVGIGEVKLGFYLGPFVTGIFLLLSAVLLGPLGALGVAIALVISNAVSAVALSHFIQKHVGYSLTRVFTRVRDVWGFVRDQLSRGAGGV